VVFQPGALFLLKIGQLQLGHTEHRGFRAIGESACRRHGFGQNKIRLERNVTSLKTAFSATPCRVWQAMTDLDSVSHEQYHIGKSERSKNL
jgi:hypothetical protein